MQPHCKCIIRSSYDGHTVAVRWHTLSRVLENRTAASRRPSVVRKVIWRRSYGELVVGATTLRVPYGHSILISVWSLYGLWLIESYERRAVAETFVTTTTAAHKTYDLKKHVYKL